MQHVPCLRLHCRRAPRSFRLQLYSAALSAYVFVCRAPCSLFSTLMCEVVLSVSCSPQHLCWSLRVSLLARRRMPCNAAVRSGVGTTARRPVGATGRGLLALQAQATRNLQRMNLQNGRVRTHLRWTPLNAAPYTRATALTASLYPRGAWFATCGMTEWCRMTLTWPR